MEPTFIQSPNGTIYECIIGDEETQQWQNESESWSDHPAPVEPVTTHSQSNGMERTNPLPINRTTAIQSSKPMGLKRSNPLPINRSTAIQSSKPMGLKRSNPLPINRLASTAIQSSHSNGLERASGACRTLEYPDEIEADESKNEKDRLCHVIPEDFLYQCEEHFLQTVFACPSIWNHKIDIKDRHPETKSKKWITIKNDMVAYLQDMQENICLSKIKVEMLKNTWNHFRENYVRYKNESQPSSGSAAKDIDPSEHCEVMRTYDDMIQKRKQVSTLEVEGDEAVGNVKAFYTPKNKYSKPDKSDTTEALSPFLASATSFLSKLSDDSEKATTRPSITTNTNESVDKAVLFANSIVPDLQKFDDEHFAFIKMIIAKDIYDVLLKQMNKGQKQ